MNRTTIRVVQYALGWGIGLWLIGYVLGIVLFFVLPGPLIMPIGVVLTIAVLLRVKHEPPWFYVTLSVVWTALAVSLDYVLIVKLLNPADGYYKPDVYLYYALTFALPLLVGAYARTRPSPASAPAT